MLTITAPAHAHDHANLELNTIHPRLDWINLKAFDFTVASSPITNFNAPLFPAPDDPAPASIRLTHNVDAVVKAYLEADVPADKLVVGVHFAGTGWQGVPNVNNGLYQTNTGPAQGTWDAAGSAPSGSFGYQDLETNYLPTYTRYWHGAADGNSDAQVPWLFNPATGIMISFEDPQSLTVKANYVLHNQLGGIMIWDLSADDSQHTLAGAFTGSLVPAAPFVQLTGANLAGTVLANLAAGAPAQEFLNTTLNSALRTGLAAAATSAGQPVLASLVQTIPAVDISAQSNVTVHDFVSAEVTLPTDPTAKVADQAAIATLSTTTTIGTLLGLNTALQDNPILAAQVNRLALATMLGTTPSLAAQPQVIDDFVRLYAGSTSSIQAFWTSLSQNAEFQAVVPDMQLTLQLGNLTLQNAPLVQALQNLRQQGTFQSLQDLVKLNAVAWTKLIATPINGQTIAIPAGIAGATPQAQTANYVAAMMSGLQAMFPTAALANNLATAAPIDATLVSQVLKANPGLNLNRPLPLNLNLTGVSAANQAAALAALQALRQEVQMFPGFNYQSALGAGGTGGTTSIVNPVRTDVATFLANSPDFDFQATNVDSYILANPKAMQGVSNQAQTITQLKRIQRIYRIAPDYATMTALMGEGLNSSYGIAGIPKGLFVRHYGGLLGGPEAAQKLYNKAQHVAAQASMLYMRMYDLVNGVNFGSLNPAGIPERYQCADGQSARLFRRLARTTAKLCSTGRCQLAGPLRVDQFLPVRGMPRGRWPGGLFRGPAPVSRKRKPERDWRPGPESRRLYTVGCPGRLPERRTQQSVGGNSSSARHRPTAGLALSETELRECQHGAALYRSRQRNPGKLRLLHTDKTELRLARDFQQHAIGRHGEQLSVNPEYTIQAVYDPTAGPLATAFYPFKLPYDRSLAVARNYLEFAGSSLYEVMKTYQFGTTPTSGSIAWEYLEISPAELKILTGQPFNGTSPQSSESDLGLYYGYPAGFGGAVALIAACGGRMAPSASSATNLVTITTQAAHGFVVGQVVNITGVGDFNGTFPITAVPTPTSFLYSQAGPDETLGGGSATSAFWYSDISAVANFLQQTGVSFQDLISLLFTRFLNPAQSITLQVDPNDMCDVDTMMIANLAPFPTSQGGPDLSTLQKIYRFVRLYKKLDWQIPGLDKALTALNTGDINISFIWAAAQLNQLQASLSLPLVPLLSLWSNIDTDGRDSLYISLFQNKTVINPVDTAFQLTYLTPLNSAAFPTATLPSSAGSQLVYDLVNQLLRFTGTMTDQQYQDLLGWAAPVSGATPAQAALAALVSLAVQNLYNQRQRRNRRC